jgi:hypothetical protein
VIVNFSEEPATNVIFISRLGHNNLNFPWGQQKILISMNLTKIFNFLVELAMIMDRLYGGVCYAGIDTDPELKYPKVTKYKSSGIN